MEEISQHERKVLRRLYAILDAGEMGYAVAAANVDSRAVKMLFKTYARQRADFKAQLQHWDLHEGRSHYSLMSILSMIHRGRIDILAAMTIGELNRDRVVLKEVLVGERAALREYRRAIESAPPNRLGEVVRKQYDAIKDAMDQVQLMRGRDGKQLVIRLYDNDAAARQAVRALQEALLTASMPDEVYVEADTQDYFLVGHSQLLETILSGACGGAL